MLRQLEPLKRVGQRLGRLYCFRHSSSVDLVILRFVLQAVRSLVDIHMRDDLDHLLHRHCHRRYEVSLLADFLYHDELLEM